jgi:hypothetical protein
MAFPTGWQRRCALVVQHGQVPANQTAFPVLITEACLPSEMLTTGDANAAQSDGGDIRFSSDLNGTTQLACEIVTWTQNASPASAKAEIWVPVDVLTASDVTIYVWYKGGGGLSQPAANASFGSQAVWDSGYMGVWHLPDGTTLTANDSTSNARNLTIGGSWGAAAAKINGGTAKSNGTTQRLTNTGIASPATITISCWQKVISGDQKQDALFYFGIGTGAGFAPRLLCHGPFSDSTLYWDYGNPSGGSGRASTSYTTYYGAFAYITLVYNNANGLHAIYINGSLIQSHTSSTSNPALTGFIINAYDTGGVFGVRQVDEPRLSNVARSGNWITTEYNNQNSPSTFIIAGTPASLNQTLSPTAIASAEAFGSDTIHATITISPSSIATAQAFGTTIVAATNTLLPSAIAPAEAFGTATLLTGVVVITPSGLASAGAFGTAIVANLNQLLPSAIASAEAFGTPTVVRGVVTILPSGIASAEAFGTLNVLTVIIPAGLVSAEAFGTPYIQATIGPTGIISAQAFGTAFVMLAVHQDVLPSSIGSSQAFGTTSIKGPLQYLLPLGFANEQWGYLRVVGGNDSLYLLINGVSALSGLSGIEIRSAKIVKQIGGFGSATYTFIDRDGTHEPVPGQEVRIGEFGRVEFGGIILSYDHEIYMSTATHKYTVKCIGFSDIATHRIYSSIYPPGSNGYNVVLDVVNNGLSGEGITTNHIDTPWSVNEDPGLTFLFKKVSEILDSIRDYSPVPADFWFIDDFRDLHFHSADSACAMDGVHITPFTLQTSVLNTKYRNLKVSKNGGEYRNVQYVRTNSNFDIAARVETVTVTAAMIPPTGSFILTKFPIVTPPSVTLNGTPIVVKSINEPGAMLGWSYVPGGVGISNFFTAVGVGTVVEFTYNSFAVNVVMEEDATAIAAMKALYPTTSGRIENIYEAKDMSEAQARQVAQGLLLQHATLNPRAPVITYETDCPDVLVGIQQTVTLPEYNIADDFVVTQMESTLMERDLGFRSSFRRQVTLSTVDSDGNPYKFLGQLITRTNQGAIDTQHEKATLLVTDGPILTRTHAGPPYQVKRNGVITAVTGSIAVAPAGDLIRIDVLLNGTSIFKTNKYLEIRTSSLPDEIVSNAELDPRLLIVRTDDVITFDILNQDDGTARDMSVVVTMETPK